MRVPIKRDRAAACLVALVVAVGLASLSSTAQRISQAVPDGVKADPGHYKVEFENEVIRVLRVKYGPGEKSVMHTHPAGCGVFLTDQTFRFTMQDGKTQNDSVRAGEVRCFDAEAHLPQNTGTSASELVIIELKNRERFRK